MEKFYVFLVGINSCINILNGERSNKNFSNLWFFIFVNGKILIYLSGFVLIEIVYESGKNLMKGKNVFIKFCVFLVVIVIVFRK